MRRPAAEGGGGASASSVQPRASALDVVTQVGHRRVTCGEVGDDDEASTHAAGRMVATTYQPGPGSVTPSCYPYGVGDFAFATCMPGLEPALKRDVMRTRPELRAGTTRPGLVTFESAKTIAPGDPPGSVFARVWGRSLGAASDYASARAQLAGLGASRVHVFAREPDAPVDVDAWQALGPGGAAVVGELVADVIVGAPGEPVWLGVHRHDDTRPPRAGGTFGLAAPSRMHEAIAWAQLPEPAHALAIGIGFARAGVEVTTVEKFGALRDDALPPRIDWLVVDINLAPQVVLQEVGRTLRRIRASVAVLMLKVQDWSFADELPIVVERLRKLGFADVRMRHLPSNRNDICVVAR